MDTNALAHLLQKAEAHRNLPDVAQRRTIRERHGLSQKDLAEVLGVTTATISRWETGARQPAGQDLIDYCNLLERLEHMGLAAAP